MENNEIIDVIRQRLMCLNPSQLIIYDDSKDHIGHQEAHNGIHLSLEIQSNKLLNMPLLAQHRLIYQTIGQLSELGIHALAIKVNT